MNRYDKNPVVSRPASTASHLPVGAPPPATSRARIQPLPDAPGLGAGAELGACTARDNVKASGPPGRTPRHQRGGPPRPSRRALPDLCGSPPHTQAISALLAPAVGPPVRPGRHHGRHAPADPPADPGRRW